MTTPKVEFTQQEAQTLIAQAQLAPLQNMQHAKFMSDLCAKFAQWHAQVTAEPAEPTEKRTRKPRENPPVTPPNSDDLTA